MQGVPRGFREIPGDLSSISRGSQEISEPFKRLQGAPWSLRGVSGGLKEDAGGLEGALTGPKGVPELSCAFHGALGGSEDSKG